MIVQLIVIKCVQICEAVWAESHTQSTTPIRDRRTHGRTDMNLCPPFGAFTPRGTITLITPRSFVFEMNIFGNTILSTYRYNIKNTIYHI